MKTKHNKKLKTISQNLRKSMTKEERKLWYEYLKQHSLRFNRQKIIGDYVVDFYCAQINLVIELDGSQHYDTEKAILKDRRRTDYIESFGIKVIRIQNIDINNNFRGVCESLEDIFNKRLCLMSSEKIVESLPQSKPSLEKQGKVDLPQGKDGWD